MIIFLFLSLLSVPLAGLITLVLIADTEIGMYKLEKMLKTMTPREQLEIWAEYYETRIHK
jgi:thioester reductase-like protein